jgi:hypothetical protein
MRDPTPARGLEDEPCCRIDLQRRANHEQNISLGHQLDRLVHGGHHLAKPNNMGPQLAPEFAHVSELDIPVAQMRDQPPIPRAPGLENLPVEVEDLG